MGTHHWEIWFLLLVFVFHDAELIGDYPCGKIKKAKMKRRTIVLEYNVSIPFHSIEIPDFDYQNFTTPSPYDTLLNRTETIIPEESCKLGECPWQASLLSEGGHYICGGTILNHLYVLPAASCVAQKKLGGVVVGTVDKRQRGRNRTLHTVARIYVHAKYNVIRFDSDIALIELRNTIQFTDNVIPACLPTPDLANQILTNQSVGIVTGFGHIRKRAPVAPTLQLLRLPYVGNQRCNPSNSFGITKNMFCAGHHVPGPDACKGFGGSPYLIEHKGTYFVTGIVSWGEGCGEQGKYGVYTKVSNFMPWLMTVMRSRALGN